MAASDVDGVPTTTTLRGGEARQFLHELDHANGVLVVDHALEVPSSEMYPDLAPREARDHDARRRVAWARPTCPVDGIC